jgi:hypothetical protein
MIENANLHLDTTGPEAVLKIVDDDGKLVMSAALDHQTAFDIGTALVSFAADPLDLIRDLWRKLAPDQRAEFLEEAHHLTEGPLPR